MLILAYPWLLAFFPLPWLIRLMIPPRREEHAALRVPFGDRLQQAAAGGSMVQKVARSKGPLIFKTVLWLLLLFALSRPQWLEPAVTREMPTRDLLLLVDLSSSMTQEDFTNGDGKKVDRLTAVKEVLSDFLSRRQGIGLDWLFLVMPPFYRHHLPQISIYRGSCLMNLLSAWPGREPPLVMPLVLV
jgi:Ca-activated chloride channel family protein